MTPDFTDLGNYDAVIITCGRLHEFPADCPEPDIDFDLRRILSDPAHRPEGDMLDLTGLDPIVSRFVLGTPGARPMLRHAVRLVRAVVRVKPVVVMFGCAGGKHRAAAMGEALAMCLGKRGWRFWRRPPRVKVMHLHVDRPRVIKAA